MPTSRHSMRVAAQRSVRAEVVRSADAEISSLASSLSDITGRLGSLVGSLRAAGDEERSGSLLAVEKSLETAIRRLDRLLSSH